MKRTLAWLLLAALLLTLAGCAKYDQRQLLGKTSAQIQEEYGSFDCVGMPPCEDGLYRNTSCGYTLRPARKGFLDKIPEWLLFISFDENGIATKCYEGYRPGG